MEINNPADAVKYLKNNWSGEYGGPIAAVEALVDNSGYFEIPHLLMTYIDYLSGLFSGKGPKRKNTDVREFFNTYFPSVYQKASAWLIFLYRNGLVHQYVPKSIKIENGNIISWYCSLNLSESKNHLKILPHSDGKPKTYHLRLCAPEFIKDFKIAVSIFCNDIMNNSDRFKKFEEGYKEFEKSVEIEKIKVPYISEEDKDWLKNLNKREV